MTDIERELLLFAIPLLVVPMVWIMAWHLFRDLSQ